MEAPKPIRILVADDHAVVRHGLSALLGAQPDMTVVAEAPDGEEACALFPMHRPDVMLLDLRMPKLDGHAVLRSVRCADPAARVVIFSAYGGEEEILSSLQAGAQGYVSKDAPGLEIIEAVRHVFTGENYISSGIASKLMGHLNSRHLTGREVQVLQRMALSESNKEVGAALSISEGTVKTHVKSLFAKLAATNRMEAVSFGRKRGFLPDSQAS